MWIPHRVFFANLAFLVAISVGVLLLAFRPPGWRRWAEAVVAPAFALGTFIGLTATRGMQLFWWDRARLGAWVAFLVSMWLLAAAAPMQLIRRRGGSRGEQAVIGGLAALLVVVLSRAAMRR